MSSRLAVVVLLALCSCPNTSGPCTSDQGCPSTASKCCGGTCVDPLTSATHCGSCTNVCGTDNAAAKCANGVCSLTCKSGYGDCNGSNKDGCETELASSLNNCGMCGKACSSSNAMSVCDRSLCERTSCNTGYGDCNNDGADGCETNLKVSLVHCGMCGKKCEILNGSPDCSNGNCNVQFCNLGYGDCDLDAKTGCEVDLSSNDNHCSVCGMACPNGQHCKLSKCVAPELVFYGGLTDVQSTMPAATLTSFNIDTRSWSAVQVGPSSDGGMESPGPRYGHVAAWDSAGQQMLVWGGYQNNNNPADAFVWALDYSGEKPFWKKLDVTGPAPIVRGTAGAAWDPASRSLIIFGGGNPMGGTSLGDTWILDVANLKWTERLDDNGPTARSVVAMAWDATHKRALVGLGTGQNGPEDGFWAFDPASADGGGWSLLGVPNEPAGRTAVFLGTTPPMQLWGGIDMGFTPYSDLYSLDDVDADGGVDAGQAWTMTTPGNPPDGRAYATGTSAGTRRFIYGGFIIDFMTFDFTHYTDVWELKGDGGWDSLADSGITASHNGAVFSSVVARE